MNGDVGFCKAASQTKKKKVYLDVIFEFYSAISSQWPFQEPIDWRYLPYIFGLFERPKFQGFFPLNSYGLKYGTFHVLAYLHQLDLEIPIDPGDMCAVSIGSN